MDFINEANNSKRCYNELKHLKFVYVPKVYDNLTTKVKKNRIFDEHGTWIYFIFEKLNRVWLNLGKLSIYFSIAPCLLSSLGC